MKKVEQYRNQPVSVISLEFRGPQYHPTPILPEVRELQHGLPQNTRHQMEMDAKIASHLQAEEHDIGQQVTIVNQNSQPNNQPGRDFTSRQQTAPYKVDNKIYHHHTKR